MSVHCYIKPLKLFLLILFILGVCENTILAQNYASRKLAEIGENFPAKCLPATDSIFACPAILQGKSFTVCYNSKNEISHLGVSLFSPEIKSMLNLPVCNFVERLLLELILQKSTQTVKNILNDNKISLMRNSIAYGTGNFTSLKNLLNDLQNPVQFGIHKENNIYSVVWQFDGDNRFVITFPAVRELIFSTDKKEADQIIDDLFTNDSDCEFKTPNYRIFEINLQHIAGSDLYLLKGDTLLINKINSDTYYQRSDSVFQTVFDIEYPVQSLANIFITKQIKNNLVLKITHRMYGGFTPEITVPLRHFLCLFNNEFSNYCILQTVDNNQVKVSVVLRNENYNYIHLLQINANAEQIFTSEGALVADFYTNIPLHNLKNLFK